MACRDKFAGSAGLDRGAAGGAAGIVAAAGITAVAGDSPEPGVAGASARGGDNGTSANGGLSGKSSASGAAGPVAAVLARATPAAVRGLAAEFAIAGRLGGAATAVADEVDAGPLAAGDAPTGGPLQEPVPVGGPGLPGWGPGAAAALGAAALGALIGTSTRDWHAGQAVYWPASVALTLDVALQRGQSSLTHTMSATRL